MTDFRYLTFDCYGTLVDWRRGIEEALASAFGSLPMGGEEIMRRYVRAESEEESSYRRYREVLASTATRLAEEFGIDLDAGGARRFAGSVPSWPAFRDTATSLKRLGGLGYKRYVLSNVDSDLLEQTISRAGLEVDGYVTAEDVRSYKPQPGHWLRFMAKTGAKKEETLHVAQSVFHDIIPAGKLGLASAWVNRYREPRPEGIRPLYVCDDLQSLVDILGRRRKGDRNLNNQK